MHHCSFTVTYLMLYYPHHHLYKWGEAIIARPEVAIMICFYSLSSPIILSQHVPQNNQKNYQLHIYDIGHYNEIHHFQSPKSMQAEGHYHYSLFSIGIVARKLQLLTRLQDAENCKLRQRSRFN